jgi:hypothetical protein
LTSLTETDIRKSKLPVLIEENGVYALAVDKKAYMDLSPDEQQKYRTNLQQEMLHLIDVFRKNPEFPDKERFNVVEKFVREEFPDIIKFIEKGESQIVDFKAHFSMLLLDNPANNVFDTFLAYKADTPENFLKVMSRFDYYHELAHVAYGLKEPGADYMAVVQTLMDYPDSRAALKILADYRTIGGAEDRLTEKKSHTNAGEILCGVVINVALKLKPEYLERIATFSPEERRRELLSTSQGFDAAEKGYHEKISRGLIRRPLDERMDKLAVAGKKNDFVDAAKDLLENNCPFRKGTLAYEVLEQLAGARERRQKNNYSELYPAPPVESDLQKIWEGAASPKSEEPGIVPAPANPFKPR